jgi:hypothetical protein
MDNNLWYKFHNMEPTPEFKGGEISIPMSLERNSVQRAGLLPGIDRLLRIRLAQNPSKYQEGYPMAEIHEAFTGLRLRINPR